MKWLFKSLILLFLLSYLSFAQTKPVNISLVNPIQIFDESNSIEGLRINIIYGKNTNVTGVDIGLANHISGYVKGIQWGAVNIVDNGGIGWQAGIAVITNGKFEGLQSACVNLSNKVSGMQWGIVNKAEVVSGLQLGLVNYAVQVDKGIQIGLINIIKQGGQFPFFPIVNWSF